MSELDQIQADLTAIKARLNRMPTMDTLLAIAVGAIIASGIIIGLRFLILP